MNKSIRVFAPATVANLSCGFDVLGCCLDTVGDEMVLTLTSNSKVTISKIEGATLPMEAEKNVASVASGNAHADNVAPALLGGFTLVRSYSPLDVIKLNTPKDLVITVIHPQIEVKTSDSRSVIKQTISLNKAIKQWGNVGGLVAGLFTEDYDLIGRSLEDVIIEPLRSILIPEFNAVKEAAINQGALGCGISGSGPSIFSLCKGEETANNVAKAIDNVYAATGLEYDIHVSKINDQGIKILS